MEGLATLALLKTYFDANHDRIEMFVPFVLDGIMALRRDDFALQDLQPLLIERSGLEIPSQVLQTLLSRVKRRGIIKREGGRYFRSSSQLKEADLQQKRLAIKAEHAELAQRFRAFASERNVSVASDEEALATILAFLGAHYVVLLLEDPSARPVASQKTLSRQQTKLVATFVNAECSKDAGYRGHLLRMAEGLVLHNALFLSDISHTRKRFRNLTVLLDTRIVLQAIGLSRKTVIAAARESLQLLREAGAVLCILDVTLREIENLLRVYVNKLGTREGIRSLRPTELTHYFVSHRYQPSDVREIISLLESQVQELGVRLIERPDRIPKFTYDESDLARRLTPQGESDQNLPWIQHDVDCIASVLTLRHGLHPQSLDNAKAVFSTKTNLLVRDVTDWYRQIDPSGVPPAAHHTALTNYAWLKQPALGTQTMRLNELVASCYAALRPADDVWDAFLDHLRRLEDSKEITSDEAVAIIVNDLTYDLLGKFLFEEDADATTLSEVVARVRASYAQAAETEVQAAEERAIKSDEKARQLRLRVIHRANWIAGVCGTILFWGAGLVIAIGLLGLFPGTIGLIGAGAVALMTLAGNMWGATVSSLRRLFERKLRSLLERWLLGEQA